MKLMSFVLTALSLFLTVPARAFSLVTTPTINGALPNGGTLSGTVTIDTAVTPDPNTPMNQSLFAGISFTVDVNNSLFTFNSIHYQGVQNGEYFVDSYDAANDLLILGIPLASLPGLENVGFNNFCVITASCYYTSSFMANHAADVQFASVSTAPEPSSLILLGTGTLGLLGAARRRFTQN